MKSHLCTIKDEYDTVLPILPRHSPWYRKFYREFRMSTLISSSNPRSHLYYRTNTAIGLERKRHIESDYIHIIHPFSNFRTIWEMFMMVVFFFYLNNVPLLVAFFSSNDVDPIINITSYMAVILDFICIADICITFFTGYTIDHLKQVVLDPYDIRTHYLLSSLFFLDVISSLPTELVVRIVYRITMNRNHVTYINLLSLLKIFRTWTLITYMGRAADLWHINRFVFSIIQYTLMTYMILHWCACFQYIIPTYTVLYSTVNKSYEHRPGSWIVLHNATHMSVKSKYILCVYRAATLLLCISNYEFEYILTEDILISITVSFLGYIFVGLALVVFLHGMFRLNTSDIKYNSIMNQLSQYMRHKQLPILMQNRLVDYYEYRFRLSYFREETIFPTLSERLQAEMNSYICMDLIKKVTLLRDMPHSITNDLIGHLKSEVYLPNDIIIKAGTTAESMYFINCGTVAVYTLTGKEVCHLQDGAYFGEMGLIAKDQKTIANAVAIETSEVFRIDGKMFIASIKTLPELYKKLERVAERRRENTMVMEEIHRKHILEKTMRMLELK